MACQSPAAAVTAPATAGVAASVEGCASSSAGSDFLLSLESLVDSAALAGGGVCLASVAFPLEFSASEDGGVVREADESSGESGGEWEVGGEVVVMVSVQARRRTDGGHRSQERPLSFRQPLASTSSNKLSAWLILLDLYHHSSSSSSSCTPSTTSNPVRALHVCIP